MLRDQRRLRSRLDRARSLPDAKRGNLLAEVAGEVEAAERRLARRQEAVPALRYPEALPVVERKDDILAAIRDHQVVVVAGETGSGKSTQLPKICLELGRGRQGLIGHTQPRRLAARTIAERISEELESPLGEAVGYTVRFTDRVGERTLVKVMTDGILLAELQRDRQLSAYDTLIIDEAHERSLNVDFILGYLKQLLPRRPDLKVVITSATIDTERFSEHFAGAPVIEVSGRSYPVEVRYRPLSDEADADDQSTPSDRDQISAIGDAVDELAGEGPGDVLVFLSGEREIRDTAEALTALRLRETEIVPLYARLSAAEQHRVFQPHTGRRIVLATNVAETSLTVPGIRYVVDAGTARVSRYSRRTKVQRLPIEPVSQAAANQRAGRCGRVAPGICIRLYAEEDFESRPEYTDPEILRTNLASVILQMSALGLGDVADFPFVDPPDKRNIADGIALLEELGALHPDEPDPRKRLTPLGRRLAGLPLDPRLGRMVIEADRNDCVREVMVIAAALSIQDPRERPVAKRQAADELHRRFADKESDFISFLNLWEYLRERQAELSSSGFRRLCKAEHLNHLRVREWQDIYSQVRQIAAQLGIRGNNEPADPKAIHRSLLSGLLSQMGVRSEVKQEYQGARNARFAINPGSALFKKPPKWVMAAELVETTRLWARVAGRIQPEWAEELGAHLAKRSYGEPQWHADRGAATVRERVTLYGLPIVAGRDVGYGTIDPAGARQMFLQHALVEGDWLTQHTFLEHNRKLVEEVRALEDRVRRRNILVPDEVLFDFYDQRVGREVLSGRHFDKWWRKARAKDPALLDFTLDVLVGGSAGELSLDAFPQRWRQGQLDLAVSYRFEPGSEDDGVTVHLPLAALNQVSRAGFDWQVPGLRHELVTELIRSLPKTIRRSFVPAPDHARAALERIAPQDGPLLDVLGRQLTTTTGTVIPPDSWDPDRLAPHLRITFQVEDEHGNPVARGKDLDALKTRLLGRMRAAIAEAVGMAEQRGQTSWTFGTIPRVVDAVRSGSPARAYPALVDEGSTVGLRLLETESRQRAVMWAGTRRLLLLTIPSPLGHLQRRLRNETKLALASMSLDVTAVLQESVVAAVDRRMLAAGGPAWDEAGFGALRDAVRADLADDALGLVVVVGRILMARRALEDRLDRTNASVLQPAVADVRSQLARLVHPDFVSTTPLERLPDIERYLRAIGHRLDTMAKEPVRDQDRMRRVQRLEQRYFQLVDRVQSVAAFDVRWMIEELRVSLFAQSIGTPTRISEERVSRAIDQLLA